MQAGAGASDWLRMIWTPAALRASQPSAAHAASTAGPLRPSAEPQCMLITPAAQGISILSLHGAMLGLIPNHRVQGTDVALFHDPQTSRAPISNTPA